MSFYLKYELSRLIHSDGAKTFQAVEKSSRQNVLLHLVEQAASPELVDKVKRLEAGRDPELVEVGEFAGSYFVVTRPIEGFQGLEGWIDHRASGGTAGATASPEAEEAGGQPEAAAPLTATPAPTTPSPATPITTTPATPTSTTPAPATPTPPPTAPTQKQPSEFTQLFGSGAPAAPDTQTSPTPPPEPSPPRPPTSPTMLDQEAAKPADDLKTEPSAQRWEQRTPEPAPPPPASPAKDASAPQPPAAAKEPGEFTRLFGGAGSPDPLSTPTPESPAPASPTSASPAPPSPTPPSPTPPSPATPSPMPPSSMPPSPPPASRPETKQPGEFTQLFGGAPGGETATPAASVPEPPTAPPPVRPAPPVPPPPPVAPAAPPAQAPAQQGQGPGEFTRLFGGSPAEPSNATGASDTLFEPPSAPPPAQGNAPGGGSTSAGTPVSKSSGEFTQLFGGNPSEPPRLKPTRPQKSGDIEKSSGEFTRLFGPDGKGSKPPKAKTEPPKPHYAPDDAPLGSSAGGPGEFTLMFGGGSSGSSGPQTQFGGDTPAPFKPPSFGDGLVGEVSGDEALDPSKGQKASKSSKPFQAPGEFTRMFGPSNPSQQPTQDFVPAAQRSSEGYASGLFKNPSAEPQTPAAGSVPPAAPTGGTQQPAAPGEYTRMFEKGQAQQTPAAQPAPPAQAMTAAAPEPKKGPGKGMLIALIAAVLVAGLSLGAAVYLFLNRDAAPDPADPAAVEQPAGTPAGEN